MRRPTEVKLNLAANLATKTLTALVNLILVPIYVHLLGIEAYSLLGIYAGLNVLVAVIDLGLTATMNREMARLSAAGDARQEQRDLVRTLESSYWLIGVVAGVGIVFLAPSIAHHWVHADRLSALTVQRAIMMMGVVFAFQWPDSFYAGGLLGLQRQIPLNVIRGSIVIVQACGAVLILKFVSASITAYFAWQSVVFGVQTLLLAACLWRSLPTAAGRPRFRRELWCKNSHFTAGVTAITLSATILSQMDKVVLSHQAPLKEFGYYVLATNLAFNLLYPVTPMVDAIFPRLVQLVVQGRTAALAGFYHKSCQFLALIIIPAWGTAVLFARQLVSIYLHNPAVAEHVYPLFSLLVTGIAVNAIMVLPYHLQLAHGSTRLVFAFNATLICLLVPLLPWLAIRFGAQGVACVSIGVNVAYVLFLIPLMHMRVLPAEIWRWYAFDVALPLVATAIVVLSGRALARSTLPNGSMLTTASTLAIVVRIAALYMAALTVTGFALLMSQRFRANDRLPVNPVEV